MAFVRTRPRYHRRLLDLYHLSCSRGCVPSLCPLVSIFYPRPNLGNTSRAKYPCSPRVKTWVPTLLSLVYSTLSAPPKARSRYLQSAFLLFCCSCRSSSVHPLSSSYLEVAFLDSAARPRRTCPSQTFPSSSCPY